MAGVSDRICRDAGVGCWFIPREIALTSTFHRNKQVKTDGVDCADWMVNSALAQWAADLERVGIQEDGLQAEPIDWALVGRGVLLEHFDLEVIESIAQKIAKKANMRFHSLDHDAMNTLEHHLDPDAFHQPTIVYLQPGPWHGGKEENSGPDWGDERFFYDEEDCHKIRRLITHFLHAADKKKCPVILETGIRKPSQMNVVLRRLGLFDRRIRIPELDPIRLADNFMQSVGCELFDESITSDKTCFGILLSRDFPTQRRRSLLYAAIRRQTWQQGRAIGLQDIAQYAAYGTQDDPDLTSGVANNDKLLRHAMHEAGHAVIAYYESVERKLPIYCSVNKRSESLGILMAAPDSAEHQEEDPSFSDVIHRIKVCLAGRAAEHLLLGYDQVSARGASSDLEQASSLARLMCAEWGYSLTSSGSSQAGSNLLAIHEESPELQKNKIEEDARQLLGRLYMQVLKVLKTHRAALERIVYTLVEKKSLFASDFEILLQPPKTGCVKP